MPLSPSDPSYRAETTPASIAAMEQPLCTAYRVGLDAFGSKGNLVHYSGYHRSRQWILNSPDSNYGSRDYSVTQTLDQSGDANWVCAFDFTPGSWGTPENRRRMVEITTRVYTAAKARDPRLSNLREFAGTFDGKNVVTFNCADGSLKGAFDSSHLDHVHGSFWRSRAGSDHTGIVHVMLGITDQGDDDMTFLAEIAGAVIVSNSINCRWVSAGEYLALAARHGQPVKGLPALSLGLLIGPIPPGWPGVVQSSTVSLSDAQAAALTTAVSAAVEGSVGEPLTVEDITAAVDATITAKLNATRLNVTLA